MEILFSFLLPFMLSFNTMTVNSSSNLQGIFDENKITGSITVYDYKNKIWIYSSEEDSSIRKLPASTFKIPNSLIFLEEGVLRDENETLEWDRVERYNEKWNADLNLREAFKYSALWFYIKGSERVEKEKYREYLHEFAYGNQEISGQNKAFWIDGSLTISPKEQINFLVNLYEEKFPVSKKTYETVKDIMINEKNKDYVLRGKTGWGRDGSQNVIWYVGYLETGENVYFYATRIINKSESETAYLLELRKEITFDAFRRLGIID